MSLMFSVLPSPPSTPKIVHIFWLTLTLPSTWVQLFSYKNQIFRVYIFIFIFYMFYNNFIVYYTYSVSMGQDSSVGVATRYGLDCSGIESWGERDFRHPSRPALGPAQPPIRWVPGFSRGVKRPGRGVHHPSPSSAEVKERVELYLFSPFGPSWPVLGPTLALKCIYPHSVYNVRWRVTAVPCTRGHNIIP